MHAKCLFGNKSLPEQIIAKSDIETCQTHRTPHHPVAVSLGFCHGGPLAAGQKPPNTDIISVEAPTPSPNSHLCTFGKGVVMQRPTTSLVFCLHHNHHVETVAGEILLLEVNKRVEEQHQEPSSLGCRNSMTMCQLAGTKRTPLWGIWALLRAYTYTHMYTYILLPT